MSKYGKNYVYYEMNSSYPSLWCLVSTNSNVSDVLVHEYALGDGSLFPFSICGMKGDLDWAGGQLCPPAFHTNSRCSPAAGGDRNQAVPHQYIVLYLKEIQNISPTACLNPPHFRIPNTKEALLEDKHPQSKTHQTGASWQS